VSTPDESSLSQAAGFAGQMTAPRPFARDDGDIQASASMRDFGTGQLPASEKKRQKRQRRGATRRARWRFTYDR